MSQLPEPRQYGRESVTDELTRLAVDAAAADDLRRPGVVAALVDALKAVLEAGDEGRTEAALAAAPGAAAYRVLWMALARTADVAGTVAGAVLARAFALPVVIVTASARAARLPGGLSDAIALGALFERANALGPTRNFGLSNALCTLESIEGLSPLAVYRSARDFAAGDIGGALPPADIDVKAGQEQTHLRFLVGAGVSPADAPGFAETAANIGTWGRDCAKILAEQIKAPGVQVLALPRPPKDLLSAPHAGRCAQLEVALNLFASNAVRKLRLAVGDPTVIVSAHDNADVRITLSSPFAEDLVEGFHWPLHPLDDVAEIERTVTALFADMKIPDVRTFPRLLPAMRAGGVALFPRVDEWDALCVASLQ